MLTFYFSHICGIKMDTNNSATKQGAAVPTDLLQQKPHVEVIDLSLPLRLRKRRDWVQASPRLDCKPRDSLECNTISRPSGDWGELSFGP